MLYGEEKMGLLHLLRLPRLAENPWLFELRTILMHIVSFLIETTVEEFEMKLKDLGGEFEVEFFILHTVSI